MYVFKKYLSADFDSGFKFHAIVKLDLALPKQTVFKTLTVYKSVFGVPKK